MYHVCNLYIQGYISDKHITTATEVYNWLIPCWPIRLLHMYHEDQYSINVFKTSNLIGQTEITYRESFINLVYIKQYDWSIQTIAWYNFSNPPEGEIQ